MGTQVQRRGEDNALARMHKILEDRRGEIAKALPETLSAERLIKVALVAMSRQPELLNCTPESVLLALMESGQLGLEPDGREAALIPYRGKAEFQPMFQGIVRLMLRSGSVKKIEAHVVREGDSFAFSRGLTPRLDHVPAPSEERGETTHAYAIAWLTNGETIFEVMDLAELEKVRSASKASNSPAWKQWTDEMYRKAVVKRLSKYLDLSPAAQAAIEKDHAVEIGDDTPLAGLAAGYGAPPSPDVSASVARKTRIGIAGLRARMNGEEAQEAEGLDMEQADEEEEPEEDEGAKASRRFFARAREAGWSAEDRHALQDRVFEGREDLWDEEKERVSMIRASSEDWIELEAAFEQAVEEAAKAGEDS